VAAGVTSESSAAREHLLAALRIAMQ
jgi:hypothetical protein